MILDRVFSVICVLIVLAAFFVIGIAAHQILFDDVCTWITTIDGTSIDGSTVVTQECV